MKDSVGPRLLDGLVYRFVGEDFVVYQVANHRVSVLNPSSALVFSLCDGSRTRGEIAAEVASTFGVTANSVRDSLRAALGDFKALGLLCHN
jgi:hypothetical protein